MVWRQYIERPWGVPLVLAPTCRAIALDFTSDLSPLGQHAMRSSPLSAPVRLSLPNLRALSRGISDAVLVLGQRDWEPQLDQLVERIESLLERFTNDPEAGYLIEELPPPVVSPTWCGAPWSR